MTAGHASVMAKPAAAAGAGPATLSLHSSGELTTTTLSLPDDSGVKYLVAVAHQGNRDSTLPGGTTRLGSGTSGLDNNASAGSGDAELSVFHYTGAGGSKTYTMSASPIGGAYAIMTITAGTPSASYAEATISWATRSTATFPAVTGVQVDDLAILVAAIRRTDVTTTAPSDVSGMDAPWTTLVEVKNTTSTNKPSLYIATALCTSTTSPSEAPIVPASPTHEINGGIYIVSKP